MKNFLVRSILMLSFHPLSLKSDVPKESRTKIISTFFVSSIPSTYPATAILQISLFYVHYISRFDARKRRNNFSSSLCVQIGSGVHPASYTMGTGGPFPGGKVRPGRDADHSPHLVPWSRMGRNYTSSLPKRLRGV
jgi:hypothetical protein